MTKKIILWILVILWAALIFMFSHQVAEQSDKVSLSVGEKIITFMVKINIIDIPVSADSEAQLTNMAEKLNGIIRKLAHFSIYLIFGALVYMLASCYYNAKSAIVAALIICLLYAISDEIHQLFIPGRSGQISDVILDFSGSITGLLLLSILNLIRKKYKNIISFQHKKSVRYH